MIVGIIILLKSALNSFPPPKTIPKAQTAATAIQIPILAQLSPAEPKYKRTPIKYIICPIPKLVIPPIKYVLSSNCLEYTNF